MFLTSPFIDQAIARFDRRPLTLSGYFANHQDQISSRVTSYCFRFAHMSSTSRNSQPSNRQNFLFS